MRIENYISILPKTFVNKCRLNYDLLLGFGEYIQYVGSQHQTVHYLHVHYTIITVEFEAKSRNNKIRTTIHIWNNACN